MTDLKWLKVLVDLVKTNPVQLVLIVLSLIIGYQYLGDEKIKNDIAIQQQHRITKLERDKDSLGRVIQKCEDEKKESLNAEIEFYKQVNSEIQNTIKSLKE